MKTRMLALTALLAAPLLYASSLQDRVKPKQKADFPTLLQSAQKAWEGKSYGRCLALLKDAVGLATIERMKAIRAALPAAPQGFAVVEDKAVDAQAPQNPMAAALSMSVGSVVEQRYRETGGRGSIAVTITADSPLTGMFSMWIANPAMLEKGSELITYGPHNAVLKQQGQRWQLMLLISKDLVDVTVDGRDDEFLLRFFNQAAVDRLAAALAQ